MMEFEINMAEMPLGKLSRRNIQKGKIRLESLIKYTKPTTFPGKF